MVEIESEWVESEMAKAQNRRVFMAEGGPSEVTSGKTERW